MPLPQPRPGLVVHFAYLWQDQWRRGQEHGTKNRPCLIRSVTQQEHGGPVVVVAPITHSPHGVADAIELPPQVNARLGFDATSSWIVTTETNRFTWPGLHLERIPWRSDATVVYGMLPPKLLQRVNERCGKAVVIDRDPPVEPSPPPPAPPKEPTILESMYQRFEQVRDSAPSLKPDYKLEP